MPVQSSFKSTYYVRSVHHSHKKYYSLAFDEYPILDDFQQYV